MIRSWNVYLRYPSILHRCNWIPRKSIGCDNLSMLPYPANCGSKRDPGMSGPNCPFRVIRRTEAFSTVGRSICARTSTLCPRNTNVPCQVLDFCKESMMPVANKFVDVPNKGMFGWYMYNFGSVTVVAVIWQKNITKVDKIKIAKMKHLFSSVKLIHRNYMIKICQK